MNYSLAIAHFCATLPLSGKIPSVCSSIACLHPVLWPVNLVSIDYTNEPPLPSDFRWALGSGSPPDQRWVKEWSPLAHFLMSLLWHPSAKGHSSCQSGSLLPGSGNHSPSPHPTRLMASDKLAIRGPRALHHPLCSPDIQPIAL